MKETKDIQPLSFHCGSWAKDDSSSFFFFLFYMSIHFSGLIFYFLHRYFLLKNLLHNPFFLLREAKLIKLHHLPGRSVCFVNMSWPPLGNQTEELNSWPEYPTPWLQSQ